MGRLCMSAAEHPSDGILHSRAAGAQPLALDTLLELTGRSTRYTMPAASHGAPYWTRRTEPSAHLRKVADDMG